MRSETVGIPTSRSNPASIRCQLPATTSKPAFCSFTIASVTAGLPEPPKYVMRVSEGLIMFSPKLT